jgi:hypothetical protein
MLLVYSALGMLALMLLVLKGPYPLAMVGSPGGELSNTTPPKLTLLALGVFQFGLLLAIEAPMRRMLSGLRLWAATVLINSMIMTLYLWHLTIMVIVVALAYSAGGFGLGLEPGSSGWWLTRPLWIGFLFAMLLPAALLLAPLERRIRSSGSQIPSAARQITGAIITCIGIALLAMYGFGEPPRPYLDIQAFLMVVFGAGISGLVPLKQPQPN